MFRPRVIPVLLLRELGLVKTVRFNKARYIGDPINAVRIFNDLKADELVLLDIDASKERRKIPLEFVQKVTDEAFMPIGIGGGINSLADAERILAAGVEKVVINTAAQSNPDLITQIASSFGSQSVTVCVDYRKTLFGKEVCCFLGASRKVGISPVEFARKMEEHGAGELILQSVDRDGMMEGYDLHMLKQVSDSVNIPVVAAGGSGNLNHFREAYFQGGAHAVSAGSQFVYHGARRGILVNYPELHELNETFQNNQ